jgi:hypothetical protein
VIDPRALASAELRPGERLLWVGQSDPNRMLTGRDAFLIPFSVLWCGLMVFFLVQAASGGAPGFFPVIGSAFVLIGLYMLAGRFVVKRHRKRTEVYAVTDRRAFVTTGKNTRETDVRRTDRTVNRSGGHVSVEWDDRGSLGSLFRRSNFAAAQYANSGLDGIASPRLFAFYDVADGQALVQALDDAGRR